MSHANGASYNPIYDPLSSPSLQTSTIFLDQPGKHINLSKMTIQNDVSFFSLPLELRQQIYYYNLAGITLHKGSLPRPSNALNILLVSRQIHTEAAHVLYTHVPIQLSVSIPDSDLTRSNRTAPWRAGRHNARCRYVQSTPKSPPQGLLEKFDNVNLVATNVSYAWDCDHIIGKLVAPLVVEGEFKRREKRKTCMIGLKIGAHTHPKTKVLVMERVRYFRGEFERLVLEFEGDVLKPGVMPLEGEGGVEAGTYRRQRGVWMGGPGGEREGVAVVEGMARELESGFGAAVVEEMTGSRALFNRRITFHS